MSSIADRTILVHVSIRCDMFNRRDRRETEDLEFRSRAAHKAVRVNKSLLPECKQLAKIAAKSVDIRRFVERNSLPWSALGQRIMSTQGQGFLTFTAELNKRTEAFDKAVQEFVNAYPQEVQNARQSLGSLYNSEDYPPQWEIEKRYEARAIFSPVPRTDDFRLDISDDIAADMKARMEEDFQRTLKESNDKAWQRMKSVAEKALERLKEPGAIFRDSLIQNVEEVVDTMTSLNLTGDPAMFDIARDLKAAVSTHNVGTIRKDPIIRQQAADNVDAVLERMKGFY